MSTTSDKTFVQNKSPSWIKRWDVCRSVTHGFISTSVKISNVVKTSIPIYAVKRRNIYAKEKYAITKTCVVVTALQKDLIS